MKNKYQIVNKITKEVLGEYRMSATATYFLAKLKKVYGEDLEVVLISPPSEPYIKPDIFP